MLVVALLLKIFASVLDVVDRVAIVQIQIFFIILLDHDFGVAYVMLAMVVVRLLLRGRRILEVVRGRGGESFNCSDVPSTGRVKHLSSAATGLLLLVLLMVPTGSSSSRTLKLRLLVHDAYHSGSSTILMRRPKQTPTIADSLHIVDGAGTARVNQLLKKGDLHRAYLLIKAIAIANFRRRTFLVV